MKKSHKKGGQYKRKNKTRKGGMRKENLNISDINAIYKMINCPGAVLDIISIDSLYGFVFLLTIPQDRPDCIQFIGLDGKPIYQIIIKVALCYVNKPSTTTAIRGTIGDKIYEKSTMKWDDFYRESETQTQIFELFHSNPVTFGVGCCHMYYRAEPPYYGKYIGAYNKNEKGEVIVSNDENLSITNALLSRLYEISTKPLDKETITYIHTIIEKHPNYHLAFIAMDAAMNHIDKNEYDILTLRNVRNTNYYPRCIEYANAIMILLFIRLKALNIDAHSGNFLSSVRKDYDPEGYTSKIKSWMIDMGRIFYFGAKGICGGIYHNKYDRQDKLNGASVADIYSERFGRYCEYDYAFIMWIVSNWDDLCIQKMINHKNIGNILHFINTFIVIMDYSINLITYHRDTRAPPQCMRFADHITETIHSRFDSMTKMVNMLNDYLPRDALAPSFFTSEQDKYRDILKTMEMMSIQKYSNIYNYMKMIDPTIGYHEQVVSAETNVVDMIVDKVELQTPIDEEPFSNPFDDNEREVLKYVAPLRSSEDIAVSQNITKKNKIVKSSSAAIIGKTKNKVKK